MGLWLNNILGRPWREETLVNCGAVTGAIYTQSVSLRIPSWKPQNQSRAKFKQKGHTFLKMILSVLILIA